LHKNKSLPAINVAKYYASHIIFYRQKTPANRISWQ